MSSTDRRRYGVIGTGMMGLEHIRSLPFVDGANLVAVTDPNERSLGWARKTLEGLPFDPVYRSDWRQMIKDDALDAVIIATPNFTHFELLDEIMATDLAIMVEKPLCTTLEDARTIVERAQDRKALTHVGLEYRYMPPVARFIERAQSGEIGQLRMLSIREHRFPFLKKVGDWNRFNRNTGGTLVEKCCHFFDLMRLVVASEPTRIYASAGQDVNHIDERYEGEAPDLLDNAFVVVDFANGVRASLDLCMFAEGSQDQEFISATGDKARLDVAIPRGVVTLSPRDRTGPVFEEVAVDPAIMEAGHHHGATVFHLRDFQKALVSGKAAPVSVFDGLRSVEMGIAAQRSAELEQAVTL